MEDKQDRPANDFYFAIGTGGEDNDAGMETEDGPYIAIVLKDTWDRKKYWNDSYEDMATHLVESLGFPELMECCHEFECSIEEVKSKLTLAGFHYNQDILRQS